MKKLISFMLSIMLIFNTINFVFANKTNNIYENSLIDLFIDEQKVLKSEELELSRLTDAEIDILSKFYKNIEIGYFLRNTDKNLTDKESVEELKKYNSGTSLSFAIKNKAGQLVGEVILTALKSGVVNLAYWIIPAFGGNGYAYKACELLIKEIHKKNKNLVFLISLDQRNYKSKRVAEKLKQALTSSKDFDSLKNLKYDVANFDFNIKYKICPEDEKKLNFKFDTFINNVQVSSKILTNEQIKNITYEQIFEKNEIEFTKLNYYIRLISMEG